MKRQFLNNSTSSTSEFQRFFFHVIPSLPSSINSINLNPFFPFKFPFNKTFLSLPSVSVHVKVSDVNEFAPFFSEPSYVVAVDEGRLYQELISLQAHDNDCSPKYGDICRYELLTRDQVGLGGLNRLLQTLRLIVFICNYASPTSGEAYRDRRLTTNFELWVEIFVCRHVSIRGFQNRVCLHPDKRYHHSFVNISPTLVIDASMERSSRALQHGIQKIWFFFSKKFEIEFDLYFDLCQRAEIIQVGLNMHLYDDIGDALSPLWGSTSSINNLDIFFSSLSSCTYIINAFKSFSARI